MKIKKWLKDIVTEDDGVSVCIAKIMSIIAFLSFLGYAFYGIEVHQHFSIGDFANGMMQVLAGCGALVLGKQISQKTD